MIIVVDTDSKTLTIDGTIVTNNVTGVSLNDDKIHITNTTIATEFAKYRGTKEYDGIVDVIQKWFYGKLVKASWCATSVSYFASVCGILDQLGGKNENVYNMMMSCRKKFPDRFYTKDNLPDKILRDDILFFMWDDGEMKTNSSKHVCVAEYDSSTDKIFCIGGNQKDKICTLEYNRKNLYGLFRPVY